MLVVLDIDGVVADFSTCFNRWVESEHGYWPAPCDRWDWYRDYPDGERLWHDFNQPDVLCRELGAADPYPDAADGIAVLKDRHDLAFVTYRDPATEAVTKVWLERHGMGGIPVVHTHDKSTVNAGLYVDDHPETVAGLRSRLRNGVLMDRPWNQGWDLPRVFGWGDVLVEAARAAHTNGAVSLAG